MSGMIVVARGDHCRGAIVLDTIRILVDALVQLRGSAQRERAEKCRGNANCNKRAPVIYRTCESAHCAASVGLPRVLRKKFLQDRYYYYACPLFVVGIRRAHASLGSARASRAGDDALVIADFPTLCSLVRLVRGSFRRGAETRTRGRVRSPESLLALVSIRLPFGKTWSYRKLIVHRLASAYSGLLIPSERR